MYYFLRDFFKRFFIGSPKESPKEVEAVQVKPVPSIVHKKEYELISTTKAEPYRGPALDLGASSFIYSGSTTYLFQEKNTGELIKIQVAGLEEDSLTSILEKADEQGTVRLTKNGVEYLIGKVEAPTGVLPLK